MRLIDADALKEELELSKYIIPNSLNTILNLEIIRCIEAIDNAPTFEREPFATVTFDKDELDRIVDERVIEPIKNGELVIKVERPHGEWIEFKGGYYKCAKCGEVERAKKNFCSRCGADMRKEAEDDAS